MTDKMFKSNESLSVQELETRQELTVAVPSDVDVSKRDNNDTTIDRCSDNKGK
jgi:hypothetical protein